VTNPEDLLFALSLVVLAFSPTTLFVPLDCILVSQNQEQLMYVVILKPVLIFWTLFVERKKHYLL
jgi:hypothetical protein